MGRTFTQESAHEYTSLFAAVVVSAVVGCRRSKLVLEAFAAAKLLGSFVYFVRKQGCRYRIDTRPAELVAEFQSV